jgi:hypothetical protein
MMILHNKNKELFAKCGVCVVFLNSNCQDTDFKIAPVYQVVLQERERWNHVTKEFAILPTILQGLATMKNDIDTICDRMDKLEIALSQQLESVATVELQTWKEHQNSQLQKHRTKKKYDILKYFVSDIY